MLQSCALAKMGVLQRLAACAGRIYTPFHLTPRSAGLCVPVLSPLLTLALRQSTCPLQILETMCQPSGCALELCRTCCHLVSRTASGDSAADSCTQALSLAAWRLPQRNRKHPVSVPVSMELSNSKGSSQL